MKLNKYMSSALTGILGTGLGVTLYYFIQTSSVVAFKLI